MGRNGEAAALLARALEGFERLRMPFEAARRREALAAIDEGAPGTDLLRAPVGSTRRWVPAPTASGSPLR